MIRALIVLAGVVAIAGPAAARDVSVPIIGRDDAAVKADIRKAAVRVCQDAQAAAAASIMTVMDEYGCRRRVVAKAEAKLIEARATNARVLALNTPDK